MYDYNIRVLTNLCIYSGFGDEGAEASPPQIIKRMVCMQVVVKELEIT